VSIHDPAVTGRVIGVLLLVVLLILVSIITSALYLELSQQEQIVGECLDIRSHIGAVANGIGVFGNALHNRSQVSRKRSHQRIRNRVCSTSGTCVITNSGCSYSRTVARRRHIGTTQNIVTQVTTSPATIVIVAPMVHIEILCTIGIIAIVATVNQANQPTTDLTNLEVNPVAALDRAVVVKAQNKNINRQVGKRKRSNCTVDGNGLCCAD